MSGLLRNRGDWLTWYIGLKEINMPISTKDCVAQLIVWTDTNYNSLPKGDWNFVGEKRLKVLQKGHTRTGNWIRRAIKKKTSFKSIGCLNVNKVCLH